MYAINLPVNSIICDNFCSEDNMEPRAKTIVVAPIHVTYSDDGAHITIAYNCSMQRTCRDPHCFYSQMAARWREKHAGEDDDVD
jgi:hypothetical protein